MSSFAVAYDSNGDTTPNGMTVSAKILPSAERSVVLLSSSSSSSSLLSRLNTSYYSNGSRNNIASQETLPNIIYEEEIHDHGIYTNNHHHDDEEIGLSLHSFVKNNYSSSSSSSLNPSSTVSRVASQDTLIPRNRSFTLCVDTPRNLSYTSLNSLTMNTMNSNTNNGSVSSASSSSSSSSASTVTLLPLTVTNPLHILHDLPPQPTHLPPVTDTPPTNTRVTPPLSTVPSRTDSPSVPSVPLASSVPPPRRGSDTFITIPTYTTNPLYPERLLTSPVPISLPPLRDRHLPSSFTLPSSSPSSSASSSSSFSSADQKNGKPTNPILRNRMARLLDLPINSVRYDRCCICLEYGQMANDTCCHIPRHSRCEHLHLMAHLDTIELLPEQKQLRLPCSVCKQTWKIVSVHDPLVVMILQHLTNQLKNSSSTVASNGTDSEDTTNNNHDDSSSTVNNTESNRTNIPTMIAPPLPSYASMLRTEFFSRTNLYRRLPFFVFGVGLIACLIIFTIRGDIFLTGNAIGIGITVSLVCFISLMIDFILTNLRVRNQRIVQRELQELNANTAYVTSSDIPAWAKELAVLYRQQRDNHSSSSSHYRLFGRRLFWESSTDIALDALDMAMHPPSSSLNPSRSPLSVVTIAS